MSGCRIGKIRMKSGGAEVRIIPSAMHSTLNVSYDFGEITFRMYDGQKITRGDALWLLRCAEDDLLRGEL